MKRVIVLLISSVMLLTGCADIVDERTETGEQTITASDEAQATAAQSVQSGSEAPVGAFSSVEEESCEASEEDYFTRLEYIPNDGLWSFTAEIEKGDIAAQLGYDTPVDVTKLNEFGEVLTNLESMDEESRQRIIEQNYSYIGYSLIYVGADNADWLYGVTYYLCTDTPPAVPYYSKLFYVKDGIITDVIDELDCAVSKMYHWNEDIVVSTDTAIYSLRRGSTELNKLANTKYFSSVMAISDDYIIFYDHEQALKIYYRDSGEVFTTGIHKGLYDVFSYVIRDDILYFFDHFNTLTYRSYDVFAREFTDNDIDEEKIKDIFEEYLVINNDQYIVEPDSDAAELIVTELSTGEKRSYSFKDSGAEYVHVIGLDGSMLYLATGWGQRAAVDIEADTIVFLDYDGDDYTGLYMHCSYDSFTDTMYFWSDVDAAGAVCWVR